MFDLTDIVRPIDWAKSFTGDGLPPGPDEDYYTGLKMAKDWAEGNIEFLHETYRDYGPAFTTRIMGMKVVWLIGAEANQYMYVDNWRDFYWWGESLQGHLAGLIGNGLLASVDDTHDKARRLLDPVFSRSNLTKFVDNMIEITEEEVTKFEAGQQFDFYEWVYDLALMNATDCFMGMDRNRVDTHELHENFDIAVEFYQKPIHFQALRGPGTPHWYFQKARRKLDQVLYNEIEDRRRNGPRDNDNILDRLLDAGEDGEAFTDDEIRDQIMNLYWAGHDTTISAISWLIMLVGKHPEVYQKVNKEIKERVGDEPITAEEAIDGLPYLEMVMDETMRLYPPAWVAFRKSRKPFTMYGHEIPADTELAFSSYVTHRLPHLFDHPEAFRPERMRPNNQRDFPPGAFIPFARGPRTCIGMNFARYEIKLIVATLFRHFDYELLPGQSFEGYPIATLTPDEVRINLEKKRKSASMSGFSPEKKTPVSSDQRVKTEGSGESNGSDCPIH